ncbi:hypothetical protein LCGC14_0373090 [marine sediment metagenome]|uniref:Polysaccharide pyruvyl transferase domain-containing protein n=1 Tax=marine sediment metagenome TaxID=412755 RepID=A0A0F9TA84_9ZZZZ
MRITGLHVADTTNIGDLVCSPLLYFDYPNASLHNVRHPQLGPPPVSDAYIFGGGGILELAKLMLDRHDLPGYKIAWGMGQMNKEFIYPTEFVLDGFDLVGCRDYGPRNVEWVPCASCMSPLFDREYEITADRVTFFNVNKGQKAPPGTYGNRGTFEQALQDIGSGETVLTNSYHGMYWATLLGRKVELMNKTSSKFYQMRDATLGECRHANRAFDQKVRKLLAT